jgi:serine/threonine protein kinase/glutamine amidotransferase-like uncharacterized protein
MSSVRRSFSNLPAAESDRLEQVVRLFEQAWLQGGRPDLADFLDGEAKERLALLIELVHADLECCFRAGEPARAEDYLDRYPELRAQPGQVVALVAREFELRLCREPHLRPDEFLARFPAHSLDLAPRLRAAQPAPGRALEGLAYAFLAPPQTQDEIGRLGPYRLLKVIGTGGMAVVFQAEDTHLCRQVALKVTNRVFALPATARARFLREARLTAAIQHDHIVPIFQVGEERGVVFLAMPLLRGETLAQRLQREGKLPVLEALRIARDAAVGLAAAHSHGLVHRDIKPANLFLEGETGASVTGGRVKILDFGLARLVQGEDDSHLTTLTQEGMLLGTPDYMAPEQGLQAHAVDIRADLYSLGCTLYCALTGQPPFPGGSASAKLEKHRSEAVVPVEQLRPEVPAGMAAVTRKLLAKRPEDRYQTPAEVVAALAPFCPVSSEAIPPPPDPAVAGHPNKKARLALLRGFPRLLLAALVGGVLATLATVLVFRWPGQQTAGGPGESASPSAWGPLEVVSVPGMAEIDRVNLEKNLRWLLARERSSMPAARARIGVFVDAGVWHPGARSIVEALEKERVPCRALDRTGLTAEHLERLDALIVPGGWAPFQWAAAGETALARIRTFVEKGGRCLGVCAGAHLLSRETHYEGKSHLYPIGLFDGVAEGPVPGLPAFPQPSPVQLSVTEQGRRRGLGEIEGQSFLYSGGPCFKGGTRVEVLARFPNGMAAVIARPCGKGEVVLCGAHFERPSPTVGGDEAPPPAAAGKLLAALLAAPPP